MDIYTKIIEILKEEYNSGSTYQELADKYGVSYTHIHNLLNGKRSVSGISLDFFFRMFPHATINFSGGDFSHMVNHGGNVVGINNGKITSGCLSAVIEKILDSDELSDTEKVKVMKVLKK